MKNPSRNRKAMALSLAMLIALPIGALAQGFFQRGIADEEYYGFGGVDKATGVFGNRSLQTTGIIDNQGFGGTNGGIINQGFQMPLGSGFFVLLAAGAGYAALKRKEEEK